VILDFMFLSCYVHLLFLTLRRPPISTLFPYTTLFRSNQEDRDLLLTFVCFGFDNWAITIPDNIKPAPTITPVVNFSSKRTELNSSPKTGTSNVDNVAVTISIILRITNHNVKHKAEARTPVNKNRKTHLAFSCSGSPHSITTAAMIIPMVPKPIWYAVT